MIRKFGLFAGAALLFAGVMRAQQPPVEARIAGLEDNAEYMSLLEEDARLQIREDSVVHAVEGMRRQLRENPEEGRKFADEILELENRIFEIRTAKGRLIDRINTIEQNWVLANLNGTVAPPESSETEAPEIPEGQKVRNLVENTWFRNELPEADYAALLKAQQLETTALRCAERYLSNYETLEQLADSYREATVEAEAVEIYDRYRTLAGVNRALADSLSEVWTYVFDNKSYAYGYLLDKMGKEELLVRQEEEGAKIARTAAALSGETVSDKIVDYFLRKQLLVSNGTAPAWLLGFAQAALSLYGVSERLATIEYCRPPQELTERYFLVYEDVGFSTPAKYNAHNPIPECKVYARGTIYRILLGTFNAKRPVGTFRGVSPLSCLENDEGKWCYYAGGFATREEADEAQALLKKRGFARPEVVMWSDGVYRNVSVDGEAAREVFRIEIASAAPLTAEVRQAIAGTAGEAAISRAGQKFVVGMFDDRAVAERVAAAVRQAAPGLEIKIEEITE